MKVWKHLRLGLLLHVCLLLKIVDCQQWGFVNPQTDCKIQCLNMGVCTYDVSNPSRHRCICVIDEFEGDYCEIKITTTTTPDPLASTDGQGQIYDEEDDFHEASQDLHYTEFTNGQGTNEIQKLDNPTASQHPNQADDYAEFEPHNDELYHEAVIQPTENIREPISVESHTEATAHVITGEANYQEVERQSEWNKPEEEVNDDFYEDDSSWMMFKRRARNAAATQQSWPQIVLSICVMLFLQRAF